MPRTFISPHDTKKPAGLKAAGKARYPDTIGVMRRRICANNNLPAWRPVVWFLRFLPCKNLKLKNGMDAAIPGVLRSKTPKGQTATQFDPRKG
jgi:hypothetical protein